MWIRIRIPNTDLDPGSSWIPTDPIQIQVRIHNTGFFTPISPAYSTIFLTFSPITSRSVLVTKMDELLQKYCANQFCTPFQCEETLYSWLLSMVSCWVWSDGYQLAESGDSLDRLVSVRAFETYCAWAEDLMLLLLCFWCDDSQLSHLGKAWKGC